MVHNLFSRLLSVLTVLTLLVLAASASLQPKAALASPGVTADYLDSGSYLANEWDNDGDNNGDNNGNEWDDNGNNNGNNNGNEWDDGGASGGNAWDDNGDSSNQGILLTICAMPWYVNHPACTGGLLGVVGG